MERCYTQNRELSWLSFNERVLDLALSPDTPLLERLNFINIFSSNLTEFFMVRVGSLTDLSLLKKQPRDSKTKMTPGEQLSAIFARCSKLYPLYEKAYEKLQADLASEGIEICHISSLSRNEHAQLAKGASEAIAPLLSPQVIGPDLPFPHLASGETYIICRLLSDDMPADTLFIGLIPLPSMPQRLVPVPGSNTRFVLIEEIVEALAPTLFKNYRVKNPNVIRVTRNADIDADEGIDESEDVDYREHMKRILKKRSRLAPVRLETSKPLKGKRFIRFLLKTLGLKPEQVFTTSAPFTCDFRKELSALIDSNRTRQLSYTPFVGQWPNSLDPQRSIIEQALDHDIVLSYPYQSMDPFIKLLRDASHDPAVTRIQITLYRLASSSAVADALIAAAQNGKEVVVLLELRARFDEANNIDWSKRLEDGGCTVMYGLPSFKVHSKVCCITRVTDGVESYITQIGTGNYNENTAQLYTDFSFITSDEATGHDAQLLFKNLAEGVFSDEYRRLCVAPVQIKRTIVEGIDDQIDRKRRGECAELFFKANALTDLEIIDKLVEASQAGVKTTLLLRGICCLIPGIAGYTDNIRVVSVVGRLLEHSRIYRFGPKDSCRVFISSADLMTRNMDKRVEVAYELPQGDKLAIVSDYIDLMLGDTSKLRELKPDGTYTPLPVDNQSTIDAQQLLIGRARLR